MDAASSTYPAATLFRPAMTTAPVVAMVADESAPHQIALHLFKESHDLAPYLINTALTISVT